MSIDAEIERLIILKLSGQLNAEEEEPLTQWLNRSDLNRQEYARYQKAWELAGIEQPIDVEEEWSRFQQKHFTHARVVDLHRTQATNRSWFKYAAAVALLLGIALGSWYFAGSSLYQTAAGERQLVELSDGSRVILGGGSQLNVPRTFNWWNRHISLNGEATFEVAKDSSAAFRIKGPQTNTEVLGTAFRLQAQEQNNTLEVAEGKVAYWSDSREKVLILTAGQKASFQGGALQQQVIEDPNYDSWKSGHFRFTDSPLKEVFRQLQDFYLFDVENMDLLNAAECRFSGEFKDSGLKRVIEEIALTMGMEYELKDQNLILHKLECR